MLSAQMQTNLLFQDLIRLLFINDCILATFTVPAIGITRDVVPGK
jgi:hypothetical protein